MLLSLCGACGVQDDIENLRARIRATQEEEKAKEVAREMKRKQIEEARRSRQSADEGMTFECSSVFWCPSSLTLLRTMIIHILSSNHFPVATWF